MYRNGQPEVLQRAQQRRLREPRGRAAGREWAPDPRPFFIWASHVAPHGTARPRQRHPLHRGAAAAGPVPGTGSRRTTPPSKAAPRSTSATSPTRPWGCDAAPAGPLAVRHVKRVFRARIRSLQGVDQGVSRVIRALKRTGEIDNTYVVFTSDNGFLLGEHRLLTRERAVLAVDPVPLIVAARRLSRTVRSATGCNDDRPGAHHRRPCPRPAQPEGGRRFPDATIGAKAAADTVLIQAGPQQQRRKIATAGGGAG